MKVSVVFSDVSVGEAESLWKFVEEQDLHLSHDKPPRRRRTKEELLAAAEAKPEPETISPTETELTADELTPPSRRRRAAAAGGVDQPADAGSEDKPVRRRRRRSAESDTGPSASGEESQPAPPVRSRPRRAKEAESDPREAQGGGSDNVTDVDVAKAASEAARALTSPVVLAVLEEFGVGNVAELSQEQRREFTGQLREKVDAAGGAIPF